LNPVAVVGDDQFFCSSVLPSLVDLDGSGSCDPDGDTLSYSWLQVDGPWIVLNNAQSAEPNFVPEVFGVYMFELVVNDGDSNSAPDVVTITIANQQAVYYVDGDANSANDGSSWEDAFNHLQDALFAVSCGKEIRVAEGIYEPDANSGNPDGNGDRNATFQLVNGVRIKGGYAGVGAPDPNERNVWLYETILCGDLNGDDGPGFVNNAENSYHVVTGSGTDDTAVLDGFTITGGNANDSDPCNSGSGMYNNAGSPTVSNCTFISNQAVNGGGMANRFGSNPMIVNCRLSGNQADFGGGIYNFISNPTVVNCVLTGNIGSTGGGMYNYFSIPVLTNCTLGGNSGDLGGGMYNVRFSHAVLTNCILWGNTPDEMDFVLSIPVVTYSDVQGSWAGTGNIDSDPCFVQEGFWDSNGTDEDISDDFWIDGDYRLLPWSPCIDVGDNNSVALDESDLDGDGNTSEPLPFDLKGEPRLFDGDYDGEAVVDMGAYEVFLPPIDVWMKLTPHALNPFSRGRWVKAHFVLPDGFVVDDVDVNRPCKLVEPFEPDVASDYVNVFVNGDGLVEVEAMFIRSAFCSAGPLDGSVVVVGRLTDGRSFVGTDTIRAVDRSFERLAEFAGYWLRGDCGGPDWCEGLDSNEDGVVNFADFARLEGCEIN
jgi:hypothetical protein